MVHNVSDKSSNNIIILYNENLLSTYFRFLNSFRPRLSYILLCGTYKFDSVDTNSLIHSLY